MKALVLNSGGMDSTVCTGMAVDKYGAENVVTVSIYYGQRHDKELQCARDIAEYYGVRHIEKDVSSIMEYSNEVCTLLKTSIEDVKDSSYAEQIAENGEGRVATYVSYRNGLFLSIAAALADGIFNGQEAVVVYGAHSDDAAGNAYADCSPEFADAQDKAISIGTYGKIHVWRPLINWNKSEVCKAGLELKVPFEKTWSCYHGREKACGCCGTCLDRIAAFKANNAIDPIEYEGEDPFADMRRKNLMSQNKFDNYMKFMEEYLETHENPTVSVDDNVRYLMAQKYCEGFNDGRFEAMEILSKENAK